MRTIQVPKVFQPHVRVHFPSFQKGEELEWHAWGYFKREMVRTSYSYLPLFWCPYYVTIAQYATDKCAVEKLQSFLKTIKGHKLITTNIYDGWPNDTGDIVVFSGSGSPKSAIPIPLICDPHPDASRELTERKTLISSIYSYGTHPIRRELLKYFDGKEGCICEYSEEGKYSIDRFRNLMKQSTFALTPRGSGATSFRMYEALQYNCIPVYVSDKHWLPFEDKIDWDMLAVLWPTNLYGLYEHLISLEKSGKALEMRKYGAEIYNKFFTYDGCFRNMKRIIEEKYR